MLKERLIPFIDPAMDYGGYAYRMDGYRTHLDREFEEYASNPDLVQRIGDRMRELRAAHPKFHAFYMEQSLETIPPYEAIVAPDTPAELFEN